MKLYEDRIAQFLDQCTAAGIRCPVKFMLDKMPRVYGFLKGAFPRGILPTDIDGEVELGGKFLRMEFKFEDALREGRIPKGQSMCFDALIRTGFFTVFIIGHDKAGKITLMHVWSNRGRYVIDPCDEARLWKACANWSKYVDSNWKP